LVRLPTNFGIGIATHVAFDHAIKYDYSIVARLDSDGQHPAVKLPELVKPLLNGEADMAVGLRVNRSEGKDFRAVMAKSIRWYLTKASRLLSKGKTPTDINSGFFAVTTEAAIKLNTLNLERYPEPQIFLSAQLFEIKMTECSIQQNHRAFGRSSINVLQALAMLYRFHILLLEIVLQTRLAK